MHSYLDKVKYWVSIFMMPHNKNVSFMHKFNYSKGKGLNKFFIIALLVYNENILAAFR